MDKDGLPDKEYDMCLEVGVRALCVVGVGTGNLNALAQYIFDIDDRYLNPSGTGRLHLSRYTHTRLKQYT